MRPLPPRAAALAALLAGSGLLLATPAPAVAAPACGPQLGAADGFTEFVLGDTDRFGESEGAVAAGGDADFTRGFSIAGRPAPTDSVPEDTTLVVGGTLRNGAAGSSTFTVLERGTAVYGGLDGRPPVVKAGLEATEGGSPVDFPAEFRSLRALSERLDALPARGSVARTTNDGATVVRLLGEDEDLNVFPVSASRLESAQKVLIVVPEGATTVVNVSGPVYENGPARVETSTGEDGDGRRAAGRLLWNFPDATTVTQPADAHWPGSVLAPHAAVELDPDGRVTGTVVAASLTGKGSDTLRAPFTGCLDTPLTPPDGGTGTAGEDDAAAGGDGAGLHLRALLFATLGALAAGAAALWAGAGRGRGRDRERPGTGHLDVTADGGRG
ncbi:choice-of-anchor A family protein [Streptomyces chumphonensis]|uniref:Choice-of-anchor A family protein n=1 Tax=Streptomyces chumphonensis TaxID=1214925 RepID=A0A927EVF1_9ACTN|nr:choice-of-anchor A family protein [Streptomyces chumphonensis]MBD3930550.1 choice-of-anchor A family protein [Streptomyces chumphonensis]